LHAVFLAPLVNLLVQCTRAREIASLLTNKNKSPRLETVPMEPYPISLWMSGLGLYGVILPVGCVRFGKHTLVTYVLEVVTFRFLLVLDNVIHAFILRANRAQAIYKAYLLFKIVL